MTEKEKVEAIMISLVQRHCQRVFWLRGSTVDYSFE